jgi:broad specificity phosphatase PhoE
MTATSEIVLVRHAETAWSREGRHTGRSDVPLTDHGRELARALAQRLRRWEFRLVLVSPSTRARETCSLCGLDADAQVREDLSEWDYGEYESLTSAQIRAQHPGWVLWRDGCPGGESPADVGTRADRVLAELRACSGAAAVFSHGHLLRVLGAHWIALGADGGGRLGLSTAAICMLGYEHRTPVIARWNDTSDQ